MKKQTIKIEIKSWLNCSVLFSHECEDNTIKITLEVGIKTGADLRGACLQGAYLQDANLRDANLRGANLRDAYLRGANLQGADLRGAYLQGANLQGANLRGAYLQGADDEKQIIQDIKQIGNIGSRGGFTICFKCEKSIIINCGCFWGTLAEFIVKVELKDKDDIHRKHYLTMVKFIKEIWE